MLTFAYKKRSKQEHRSFYSLLIVFLLVLIVSLCTATKRNDGGAAAEDDRLRLKRHLFDGDVNEAAKSHLSYTFRNDATKEHQKQHFHHQKKKNFKNKVEKPNKNEDWESLLLKPFDRKYPKLRQLYKRALTESRSQTEFRHRSTQNTPKFELPQYQHFCKEDVPIGTSLVKVMVTGITNTTQLKFSLDDSVNFTVNEGGDISSNARLDFDYNGGLYTFKVNAYDSPSGKNFSADVRIYTENTNDEPPQFSQDIYPSRIDENAKPNALVTTVVASDKDGDRVRYDFATHSRIQTDMFVIDGNTGVIRLGPGALGFDKDTYELNVTATDDGSCCENGGATIHTSTALVLVSIIDVNDNKPEFQDCASYKPTIKENEPRGTFVLQVTATDKDRGDNGKVKYFYVTKNTEAFFQVDETTGVVKSNKVFDREGPDGKFIPLTIIAKDHGSPPLEGVCTFTVAIGDVNDNNPIFDRSSYTEKMSQNTKLGSDIFRLSATDDDADNNAVVSYSLNPYGGDTEPLQYFQVEPDSGWVSLKKLVGAKTKFVFTGTATDKGSEPRSASVEVTIEVVDRDVNPPRWEMPSYSVNVTENTRTDTVLIVMKASSGISSIPNVRYKVDPGKTVQTNKLRTFYSRPKTENGVDYVEIILGKPLDYEDVKEYNLTVRAENNGPQPLASETVLVVRIEDVNDEIPQFSDTEMLSVLEGEPPGTKVGQVHAIDKDSTFPFNKVTYSLVGPANVHELFQIDRETGVLTSKVEFDRERNQTIQIRVRVEDGAPSARLNVDKPGDPNSIYDDFPVYIGDKNDNPPKFDKVLYEAEVKENEDIGHIVITVQASDKDQSSKLRYEITAGNEGSAFSIKADIGSILVAGTVDYETKNKYQLTVTVSDGLYEATTNVNIKVIDLNDNPPRFPQKVYTTTIWERTDTNTSGLPMKILTVLAEDDDKDRPKNIVYSLSGQAQEIGLYGKQVFTVDEKTGEIFVNEPLDRDPPNGRPVWRFIVFASDEGGGPGSLFGNAEIMVQLRDINDNAPTFPEEKYIGEVPENEAIGRSVMFMTAVDNDDPNEGENAVLTYSIVKNQKEGGIDVFAIDVKTALITTKIANLDRETVPQYVVVVQARDGGGLTGSGTATIKVKDVNDSPPRFEHKTYNVTIPETDGNLISGDCIVTMKVLDDDLPETNINVFSIVADSGPGWDRFRVHVRQGTRDTGCLVVQLALDYENATHRHGFYFDVRVSDMGPNVKDPTHVAVCRVYVSIFDINDNAPIFDTPIQSVSVREDVPVNTAIATFHATDPDKNGTSKVTYAIQRSTNRNRHFAINAGGTVTIQRSLDREDIPRHIVHVLAIDDGAPHKTATATLTVNVEDVNDNAPEFKEDYRPVVPENVPPELFVIEVEAFDRDDYAAGNGPPFKFWLDEKAPDVIKTSFRFQYIASGDSGNGSAKIFTKVTFDREVQKEYLIPIVIEDSGKPRLSSTNTLTVIIGDDNDNEMGPGSTEIFVYNYRGLAPESEIGRVYVEDKDDWDLPFKTFNWKGGEEHPNFKLDTDNGNIIMKNATKGGVYVLFFTVFDSKFGNTVEANATVTIKEISELAVFSSGSIRMSDITEEEFIGVWDQKDNKAVISKYQKMKELIADIVKADLANLDLFTVKRKQALSSILDIRFSAHGSPYYKPEKLNGLLAESKLKIEEFVGVNVTMIGIDECLYENVNCESSCSNELEVSTIPYVVNANKTSLAGVRAEVTFECTCRARNFSRIENCGTLQCYNGGTCYTLANGNVMCQCPRGFDGPRCQQTTIGFKSDGFSWFSPFEQCEDSHLSLEFLTTNADGLIFYNGPISNPEPPLLYVQDFISLELSGGSPRLLIDFGSGTLELKLENLKLNDFEWHRIDVFWSPELVRLVVDMCEGADMNDNEATHDAPLFDRSKCEAKGTPPLFNEYLNVNAPLQIGGVSHKKLVYDWQYEHTIVGFIGCIKNVVFNSEMYDLGTPAYSRFAQPGCPMTEDKCRENDVEPFCINGTCIASNSGVHCECRPGFVGSRCDMEAPDLLLNTESYIKYKLQFTPNQFKSGIMLRFRTSRSTGELFRANGVKPVKEFLILEVRNGRLLYRFNLHNSGREEGHLWLSNVAVDDGQWHSVYLARYGSIAFVSLDGGEGRRYNETLSFEGLHQLLEIQSDAVFVGGFAEEETGLVLNDLQDSCVSDIRFDTKLKQLPLPPSAVFNEHALAEVHNAENSCPKASCVGIGCPDGMSCIQLWNFIPVCICPLGYVVAPSGLCVDKNECDVFPCKNGASCENTDGGFVCHCVVPFTGQHCDSLQDERRLTLGTGALVAILICGLAILILALVLVVYTRSRRTNYGPVYPDDDIRENIINYNDEGGGEDDMNTYDIGALRIPVDHMGTPLGLKPGMEKPYKEPRQNRGYSPGSEPDVGDFISSNLDKADEDPDALPSDDVRVYAYEGAGSTAGSLSSLASGTDDNEQDFDYLNNWGPRFQKLADMYGQGESEDE